METRIVDRQRVLRTSDVLATVGALLVIPVIGIELRSTDPRWIDAAVIANWAIWLVFLFDAGANVYISGRAWLRKRSSWLDDKNVKAIQAQGIGCF